MDLGFRIFLIVLSFVAAIILGLLLRRWLMRRLKKTILDTWLVQTLGVLIALPTLLVALATAPLIWSSDWFFLFWEQVKNIVHIQDITAFAWGAIQSILVFVIGLGLARTIMNFAIHGLSGNHVDINLRTLIGRIFFILILLVTVFWLLAIWQVSIALPVALIGTFTVVMAFAVQDILKDLVAGFYILMERPFHIGDQITVGDQVNLASHTGKVEDVQIRATKLRLISGEQIAVPNSLVFGGIVINNSFYGERRATITIALPEEEFGKDETCDKITKALKEIDTVMPKPEPMTLLSGYSGKRVNLKAHFWVASGHTSVSTISEALSILHTLLPNADLAVQEAAGDI